MTHNSQENLGIPTRKGHFLEEDITEVLATDWKDLHDQVKKLKPCSNTSPQTFAAGIYGFSGSLFLTVSFYYLQDDSPNAAVLAVGITAAPLLAIVAWALRGRAANEKCPGEIREDIENILARIKTKYQIAKSERSEPLSKEELETLGSTRQRNFDPERLKQMGFASMTKRERFDGA